MSAPRCFRCDQKEAVSLFDLVVMFCSVDCAAHHHLAQLHASNAHHWCEAGGWRRGQPWWSHGKQADCSYCGPAK